MGSGDLGAALLGNPVAGCAFPLVPVTSSVSASYIHKRVLELSEATVSAGLLCVFHSVEVGDPAQSVKVDDQQYCPCPWLFSSDCFPRAIWGKPSRLP